MTSPKRPLVWLPADHRDLPVGSESMPFLVLGHKYAAAVRQGAQAQPVVFALAQADEIDDWLAMVDGVLLTGSPSNVHPAHFGQPVADARLPLDTERDGLTLALVQACIRQAVPLLGVCRGFQEINVALGGTLHQQVHAQPGLMDHRENKALPLAQQYAPSHDIAIAPGSLLAQWADGAATARVNSLHGQGIADLALGLQPMAHAPDGLIEAYAVQDSHAMACAVQWHPEWRFQDNPLYAAIWRAFGQACAQRRERRWDSAIRQHGLGAVTPGVINRFEDME